MKLTYNDIHYIIEQTSKIILEADREVRYPLNKGEYDDEGEEIKHGMVLVRNNGDETLPSNFTKKYPLFIYNNTEYVIYPEEGGTIEKTSPLFLLVKVINSNPEIFFQKINYMRICDGQDEIYGNRMALNLTPLQYLEFLISAGNRTVRYTVKIGDREVLQSSNPLKYVLNGLIENSNGIVDNIFAKLPKYGKLKIDTEMRVRAILTSSQFYINRLVKKNGKYSLMINDDIITKMTNLMGETNKLHGIFYVMDSNRQSHPIEYINISHFSTQVAAFLKKNETPKKNQSAQGPVYGEKVKSANPDEPNIDINNMHNPDFIGNDKNNRTLNVDAKGKLVGAKKGDIGVYSGDMIAKQSAECMAYVIHNRIKGNIGAILSIQSSSDYNEKTIDKKRQDNDDNILYYLKNTFGENVGDIQTDANFFKKCLYMYKVLNTTGIEKSLENMFFHQLIQCLQYIRNNFDIDTMDKIMYCNEGENPEIFDKSTKLADFKFLRDRYYTLDKTKQKVQRTWKGIPVETIFKLVEDDKWTPERKNNNGESVLSDNLFDDNGNLISIGTKFYKWEIKSLKDDERKAVEGFLHCAFDGTITTINAIKKYSLTEGEDEYTAKDNTDVNNGIILFDDNFASGSTLKEAARVLVAFLNINPERIICLTPGWMASKE